MREFVWLERDGRMVGRFIGDDGPDNSSELPFPRIMSDQIEIQSMADGKVYTSKAELRRSYRQQGYIEVGNEDVTQHVKRPKPDRKPIREAVGRAMNRVGLV